MTGCCCVVVMAIPQRMFGGVVFGRCEVGEAMSLPGGIQNMNSSFSAAAPAAATGTSSAGSRRATCGAVVLTDPIT